jgi:hypothetical protein
LNVSEGWNVRDSRAMRWGGAFDTPATHAVGRSRNRQLPAVDDATYEHAQASAEPLYV